MAVRRYWNKGMETISSMRLEALESSLLRHQLAYVYRAAPFYRRKFDAAGVAWKKVRSRRDLAVLPFTTKDDLRKTQAEIGGLGGLRCAPSSSIVRIQGTSGTSGRPLYVGLTRSDVENWKELFARIRALPIKDEVKRKWLGGNARRVLGSGAIT